jgi:hypothetical protein
MVESDNDGHLQTSKTVPVGFSDHRLVTELLHSTQRHPPPGTVIYRSYRRINLDALKEFLRNSTSFTNPVDDPDELARMLDADMRAALNQLAPLHSMRRRPPKPQTRWLSPQAQEATRERRRLERRFSRSKSEVDRRAYRAACRSAHRLINTSLSEHVCSEVLCSAHNPKLLWKTVTRLLHPRMPLAGIRTLTQPNLPRICAGSSLTKSAT